jgi:hypothetical protein
MNQSAAANISHFGLVAFEKGQYVRKSGSANWKVQPVPGFGLPIGPPVGMVRIIFDGPVEAPYAVLASGHHSPSAPMLTVNTGKMDKDGFVVLVFDPVTGDRTLQNGDFSFAVLTTGG